MSREEKVSELCRPLVESMGYEWVGVEYHHNTRNAILRIYVDKPEGGIGIDDIVEVTEQINPLLDVEDPISAEYTLEVSSPGMDRPLFELAHFAQFVGAEVKLMTRRAVGNQRKFTGVIESVDQEAGQVSLLLPDSKEQTVIVLDYENIDKARLVPIFED
ncbi:ribosome maturation factor RimP [Suttonella sp. R2A3]|uniref:ribosome maturation factor RimP n=1 Tax=Suttonella sp. R2A3 TaxID=2908648 RepID=UPI001F1ABBCF|nr:ribosome maturation factor RimP [Suttonella sp. R2A3]UJF24871.1 ribosome maturation factor RimP [Suttonella sp. R2A3]